MKDQPIISYEINSLNHIISISGGWSSFYRKNAGKGLAKENIIGQSILKFFDSQTGDLYKIIFEKIRETNRDHSISIRCDSPNTKRYINLEMKSLPGKHILFSSQITSTEKLKLLTGDFADLQEIGESIIVCSFCNLIRANGKFVEIEEASKAGVFSRHSRYNRIYTICNPCKDNPLFTIEENPFR